MKRIQIVYICLSQGTELWCFDEEDSDCLHLYISRDRAMMFRWRGFRLFTFVYLKGQSYDVSMKRIQIVYICISQGTELWCFDEEDSNCLHLHISRDRAMMFRWRGFRLFTFVYLKGQSYDVSMKRIQIVYICLSQGTELWCFDEEDSDCLHLYISRDRAMMFRWRGFKLFTFVYLKGQSYDVSMKRIQIVYICISQGTELWCFDEEDSNCLHLFISRDRAMMFRWRGFRLFTFVYLKGQSYDVSMKRIQIVYICISQGTELWCFDEEDSDCLHLYISRDRAMMFRWRGFKLFTFVYLKGQSYDVSMKRIQIVYICISQGTELWCFDEEDSDCLHLYISRDRAMMFRWRGFRLFTFVYLKGQSYDVSMKRIQIVYICISQGTELWCFDEEDSDCLHLYISRDRAMMLRWRGFKLFTFVYLKGQSYDVSMKRIQIVYICISQGTELWCFDEEDSDCLHLYISRDRAMMFRWRGFRLFTFVYLKGQSYDVSMKRIQIVYICISQGTELWCFDEEDSDCLHLYISRDRSMMFRWRGFKLFTFVYLKGQSYDVSMKRIQIVYICLSQGTELWCFDEEDSDCLHLYISRDRSMMFRWRGFKLFTFVYLKGQSYDVSMKRIQIVYICLSQGTELWCFDEENSDSLHLFISRDRAMMFRWRGFRLFTFVYLKGQSYVVSMKRIQIVYICISQGTELWCFDEEDSYSLHLFISRDRAMMFRWTEFR